MAFYCLTEYQIRQLYQRRIKPESVMVVTNQLVFTYTGEDVLGYAGEKRAVADDQLESICEEACSQSNLGDMFADAVMSVMGDLNKFEELDQ